MVSYDLSDRVAFVTGAARGMGRAIAQAYARAGADVVVTDICEDVPDVPYELGTAEQLRRTKAIVAEEGVDVLQLEVDIRDEMAVRSAFSRTADRFGRVDILANNAGVWTSRPLHKLDEETWDAVVETNLKGAWLPTKYAVPLMRTGSRQGRILTTASVAGRVGAAGAGHYAAAMHGVVGLTKTLALELAADDITVNAVCPTGVDTPMISGMWEAAGPAAFERISDLAGPMNVIDEQLLEPRDIADAYLWLSSDAARYVTGTALPIDAGMTMK